MSLEQSVESKIKELATEVCEREELVLYDVEYVQGKKNVIIYVDKEDGEVDLDDCAKISSGVSFLLDVEDPIENKYNLEVSSPGLERKLTRKWHYQKQLNKEINVVFKARTEMLKFVNTKQLSGVLKKINENTFIIESEEKGSVECSYEDVHKCNLVFDFNLKLKS